MSKDYFQDITPPSDDDEVRIPIKPAPETRAQEETHEPLVVPERSIRNVNVVRKSAPDRREVPPIGGGLPIRRVGVPSYWLWAVAAVFLILVGILSLFLFKKTTVTITPRSHTIVFDSTKTLIAYPSNSAATGTLTYSIASFDLEDSTVVASQGTSHAEHKASGSVVVVNEFSNKPLNLVKNTRFSTPDGLIFRTPADIQVPAMNGKTPGTVTVTVVADEIGSKYNVGPISKLTLPGLKGGAMYEKVYARSAQAFSGGFSGDEPAVAQATRDAAISEIRGHLQDAFKKNLDKYRETSVVYPNFAHFTYSDETLVPESTGQVRIKESIHVDVPIIDRKEFLSQVASSVSADAENAKLTLIPKEGYSAQLVDESASPEFTFNKPLHFTISGTADLVWNVDTASLSTALAGKDQKAFETVITGFPGVEEAHARVEPFWSSTFPKDASKIEITLLPPKNAQ